MLSGTGRLVPAMAPKFTGTINEEGRIRVYCENYPEHWQEIQLPTQWVLAYQAYQKNLIISDRLLLTETLQTVVEVHADQAWKVNEADPGYAGLHRQLTTNNIDWANACGESMHSFVRSFVRSSNSFVHSFVRSFIHSFIHSTGSLGQA